MWSNDTFNSILRRLEANVRGNKGKGGYAGTGGKHVRNDRPTSFLARLTGSANLYGFVEVDASGADTTGGRTGADAFAVNGEPGLGGAIVRLWPTPWDHRFMVPRGKCDGGFCVIAWSLTGYCADATDETPIDCSEGNVPGAIDDAAITITLVDLGDGTETPYATGNTDANGTFCLESVPPPGKYRVRVQPDSCPAQSADVVVTIPCQAYSVGFGFCCWTYDIFVEDITDASHLNPDYHCGNGSACWEGELPIDTTGVSSEPVEVCWPGYPCPSGSAPDPDVACDELTGWKVGVTTCTLTLENWWDRCIVMPTRCDVPAYDNSAHVFMYGKADWVLNPCCGSCSTDDRPPEMIPKELFLTLTGPVEVIGEASRSYVLEYDEGLSDDGVMVWASNCISEPGSWGTCEYIHSDPWGCFLPSFDPNAGPIDPITGNPTGGYTCFPASFIKPSRIDHLVPYGSQRVFVRQFRTFVPGFGYQCRLEIELVNYWGGNCPDDDEAPECGYNDPISGQPIKASGIAKYCGQTCPCGTLGDFDPIDLYTNAMITKSAKVHCDASDPYGGTTFGCNLCGPVDVSACARITILIDAPCEPGGPVPILCAELTE